MTDPLIGAQLDEYHLEALLGQGGMARVYRALDTGLQRYAAIKVIDTPHQQDEVYVARFEREARAIAQLDHPHIVSVYRYGRAQNLLYLAMKYIEGADLHAILSGYEQDGQLMPAAEIIRLLHEMGTALDYAHARGIIHRDIKPSNVMLDAHGRSYITDFGLALLADVGTRGEILGSPHYVAPEQAVSSAGAVPQSDLYALGVMLYRMVTGRLPFEHDDLLELLMLHMTATPPAPRLLRPEISPSLENVILKALAKEPGDRFTSGQAMAAAVEAALTATAVSPALATPTLTIMDRVALDMETLPPVPAAVTPQMSAPRPTAPAPQTALPDMVTMDDEPSTAAAGPPLPFKAIGGAGILLLIVLAALFLFRSRSDEGGKVAGTNDATAVTTPDGATAVVVEVSLPDETVTAVTIEVGEELPTPTAVRTETTNAPQATMFSGALYLPVIAGDAGQPIVAAATPTPPADTPAPTAVPTAVAPPTNTPAPVASVYTLVFTQRRGTLFITNNSDSSFPLAGLELRFDRNGRRRFHDWGQPTLSAGACLRLSQRARDASDDIRNTGCSQLEGELLLFNWREEFEVWYNDREIADCEVEDDDRCTVLIP